MKYPVALWSALILAGLLLPGCTEKSQTPQSGGKESGGDVVPAPSTPGNGPTEDDGFLGKPLDYWTRQAGLAEPAESTDRIVEALALALESENDEVVVAAADAIRLLGPEAAVTAPRLASKLDHVQPWLRCACMDALQAIGAESVPSLVELVQSGPGGAPVRALIVLGNLGPAAKDALPALEETLEKKPDLRARITKVLALIDPERAGGESGAGEESAEEATIEVTVESAPPAEGTDRDWPGFHGPRRDAICRETGLLDEWPEEGPPLLWKLEGLGKGYSTVSIVGGRLFTMGDRQPEGQDEKSQYVLAYDLDSRKELWATRVGPPHTDGPRSTPTVDEGRVYVLGTSGDLVCVESRTGSRVWSRNLVEAFDGKVMKVWKFSESPLVDGNRLICTPGGPEAALAALDKKTGEVIWKCALPDLGEKGTDGAGYSSAVVAEIAGVRQYVQLLGRGVVGVEAATGTFLWGYNRIANDTANITTPVVRGDLVFVTTAYDTGSALLKIRREGDEFHADEVYFIDPDDFQNHHGGIVLVGSHIYGGHRPNGGDPTCLEIATGKIIWQEDAPGRGSGAVLFVDGNLIFRYDRGLVALIEATPEEYRLKGTFEAVKGKGPAWAHPVVHDGRLYLRHGDLLACYDLRAGEQG